MKECSMCKEVKTLASFNKNTQSKDGHRPNCKECEKQYREDKKKQDYIRYKTDILAHGILQRVKYDIDNPKNKCYKEHKVKCSIGDNTKSISDYLYINFYNEIKSLLDEGKTPSVDRIDSNGNYSPDNIRIIDWNENVTEGARKAAQMSSKQIKVIKDADIVVYNSISEASRELKIKRDTIYYHLDKGTVSSKGYKFESA